MPVCAQKTCSGSTDSGCRDPIFFSGKGDESVMRGEGRGGRYVAVLRANMGPLCLGGGNNRSYFNYELPGKNK